MVDVSSIAMFFWKVTIPYIYEKLACLFSDLIGTIIMKFDEYVTVNLF